MVKVQLSEVSHLLFLQHAVWHRIYIGVVMLINELEQTLINWNIPLFDL